MQPHRGAYLPVHAVLDQLPLAHEPVTAAPDVSKKPSHQAHLLNTYPPQRLYPAYAAPIPMNASGEKAQARTDYETVLPGCSRSATNLVGLSCMLVQARARYRVGALPIASLF